MAARPAPTQSEAERAFADAMSTAGFMPGPIQVGEFVRFDAPGDRAKRGNGFYKLVLGQWPVGWFGDWKVGEQHQWSWHEQAGIELSEAERRQMKREQARLKAEAAQAREARQNEVAEKARAIWAKADREVERHPYLERKLIAAPTGLRIHHAADGTRLLAVPIYAFGFGERPDLINLQLIDPAGAKRFLSGGRVAGGFFSVRGEGDAIVLCEGVATAFSIAEATGFSVVAAFNSGNLPEVAKEFRVRRPEARLLNAADDDAVQPADWTERSPDKAWINAGRKAGAKAASGAGCEWIIPAFADGAARDRTDFNDLLRDQGDAEVAKQIRAKLDPAPDAAPTLPATTNEDDDRLSLPPEDRVSEDAIATAFTLSYASTLRYDHEMERWFAWDGKRWAAATRPVAFHYARLMTRRLSGGKRQMCKASVASGVERLARADPRHEVGPNGWDPDPWMLGTPGGTIDLRTGEISTARSRDAITKLTGCGLDRAEPELWLRFLHDATGGDEALMRYLQRKAGYCLTGLTIEQALFFLFGDGGNGKGVFLNTLAHVMGDYAVNAPMDTFTAAKFGSGSHPTELARLRGARMVTASETEEGRTWAEARIKELTGGDTISARFMRQDFFEYIPAFKLVFMGNHQPKLNSVDKAMKRRFNMLPFVHAPDRPDLMLTEKLRGEAARILGWAVRGCLAWQQEGLNPPPAILAATEEYFAEQDVHGLWLTERCNVGRGLSEASTLLFNDWHRFAREAGEDAGTQTSFVSRMKKRGFGTARTMSMRSLVGLELKFRGDDQVMMRD